MFNTIKSRIFIVVALTLIVSMFTLCIFCFAYYRNSEKLILDSYFYSIADISQDINKKIIAIEDNAMDLALIGSIHYDHKGDDDITKQYVAKIFDNYKESLGGGIWFVPFVIDAKRKLSCIYGFRNKQDKIVIDESFQSEGYNYPEQEWYKQITSQLTPEDNIAWSLPYYEKLGSYTVMVTAGSGIYSKGKLVGISTVDWEFASILNTIRQIKPTPNSFTLFADRKHNYIIVSTDKYLDNKNLVGKPLQDIPWYSDNLMNITYFTYHNKTYVPYVKVLDNDMLLIVNIPRSEMFNLVFQHLLVLFIVLLFLSLMLSYILYRRLNKDVINPIDKLIEIANRISKGNTDIAIKIEKPVEFEQLASTYDKMTSDIKEITKQQTRINSELSIAKSIQSSSLPNVFPPFPEHKEFSIYASMDPAKEVGGDFYDFYFTDSEHFMFLVADVSGKGVPAALFMMTVKTLINNQSQTISDPEELIQSINKKLCANNKEGFFVTMFACIVNVKTGEMACINCGHNPPLLKRNNAKYEYLKLEQNMVLGVIDKIDYQIYNTKLNKGDSIFIYTDGITEAVNAAGEMYGEQRLEECLNTVQGRTVEAVIKEIKSNVQEYTKGLGQSDDLTMLLFQYNGDLRIFEKPAVKENYKDFYNWVHEICTEWSLNEELSNKLDMCGEEIYANICFYAYPYRTGNIKVTMDKTENELIMVFEDNGTAYNPLEKPDPDLTIPPKERPIGGLGIFMVKQMAKDIEYKRIDEKNILTIKFDI